ncbi:MAG: penicillin-binding protein 2 [Acidimicrobiia bacterium]|nr:penicillin-binding protein 2 [Acidimicrobiia bacterium]
MAVDDDPLKLRLRIFAFVALILFGALVARLWFLQGIEHEVLSGEAVTNVFEPVFEEAPRGRILDRNGRVLVDNKVVQVVTFDRNVLEAISEDEAQEVFGRLAVAISRSGRPTKVSTIAAEVADPRYGPFDRIPIAVDVNSKLMVYLGERPEQFPGVRVEQRRIRNYPFGSLAAHLLGYVGPVTLAEQQQANANLDPDAPDAKTYRPNSRIGKTGIERIFELELRGVPGVRRLEVNNVGEVIREHPGVAPIPGNDVWLTIDIDLQARAEEQLALGLLKTRLESEEPDVLAPAGSVVAIDPRNGDVLVMASFPTYDPSQFATGISTEEFNLLTSEDNYSPILNRAIQGSYAPGSTWKLVTSVAALEHSVIDELYGGPDQFVDDEGSYVYPFCETGTELEGTCAFDSPFTGSRFVDLADALTVSSDVYFYRLAGEGFFTRERGPQGDEGIQTTARRLGLGGATGVQLPYERSGVVPDRDYFDQKFSEGVFIRDGDQWFAGDTILLSIGQGDVLVTPIQLANTYATFANGGARHQPNVALRVASPQGVPIVEFGPRVSDELDLGPEVTEPIIRGLLGVPRLGGVRGTAASAFQGGTFPIDAWPVAGKTGTAEVDGKADTSLFVAWGPNDFPELGLDVNGPPEIAVAVVMEESGFGSAAAAPVAAAILEPIARSNLPRALTLDESETQQAARIEALLAARDAARQGIPAEEGSQ